jgi:hypothetical protein
MMEASAGEYEINQKFCGGPGGGFSKEPPGRRRHHAGAPDSRSAKWRSLKHHIKPKRVHASHTARRNQYAGFLADFGKSRQLRESV